MPSHTPPDNTTPEAAAELEERSTGMNSVGSTPEDDALATEPENEIESSGEKPQEFTAAPDESIGQPSAPAEDELPRRTLGTSRPASGLTHEPGRAANRELTGTPAATGTPDQVAEALPPDAPDVPLQEPEPAGESDARPTRGGPRIVGPRIGKKPAAAAAGSDEGQYEAAESWPVPPVPANHAFWPTSSGPRRFDSRKVLPWLDWRYSLILPVALLLGLVTVLWSVSNRAETIELTVLSSSSGEPIAGANVTLGDRVLVASDEGSVTFERPDEPVTLEVTAEGYIPVTGEVTSSTALEQQVMLRPSTLIGRVTDEDTGEPLEGVSISVLNQAGETVANASTDDSGGYRLTDIPDTASVVVDGGPYGMVTQDVGGQLEMSFRLAIRTATGIILDDDGEPLQGAVIQSGESKSVSTGDGTFTLEGVRDGDEITILAPGFVQAVTAVDRGSIQDVVLERQMIKAVYANSALLTSPGGLQSLIDIANTTEINAIVIDVKEGIVFYDSEVAFFNEAGTVRPAFDLGELLQQLDDNGIYAIARMVVFQDPIVARERPDLAVHDVNGGLWTNVDGVAWVSAYHQELWDANIELAVELADRGFDEIQYDYVRFPSDGDLSTADFGREYTAESREQAITEFLKRSHEAVNAAGAYLAADLFGFITIVDDEQYIGQRFSMLAPHLDFICMMIYPSHFETGNIASAPGHPNDYPYETIFESLERAEANVPGSTVKFRPWLQDFSYGFGGLRDYDATDVRAQIDAAEDFGASGWMLWGDPFNVTVEALRPDSGA